MQVGDEPNVRGAHRQLAAGMVVRPQNAWPSLRFDVKAANQLVGPVPRRRLLLQDVHQAATAVAGLPEGAQALRRRRADLRPATEARFDKRYVHVDVCVAGGGPAGMAAAIAAAEAGARVLLVEEEHRLGGHLRYGGPAELAALAELRQAVDAQANVEVITNSVVAGRYDDNWLSVLAAPGRAPCSSA